MFASAFELGEKLIIFFSVATMEPRGIAHFDFANVRMNRKRGVDRMMIWGTWGDGGKRYGERSSCADADRN